MRRALALVAATLAAPAMGQDAVVVSPAPDRVAVTVYRNPSRDRDAAIDLRWLGGFALVTETRRVRLPRGPATLRFEGVAEGIVPVSAIVDGLPGGTVEKNRDARLLSPAALIDGTLGRQVTLTRTDRATGAVRTETATLVAGPAQGVVLKTPAGIETLRCSGLAEGVRFGGVPAGLSAKPVLSVATVTPGARMATVTLSYLASGFDWSASYVATLAADGRTLDLFAWMTLANGNPQTFVGAEVSAVAGRLNRASEAAYRERVGQLRLQCYPLGTTTSDLKTVRAEPMEDIVVTGSLMRAPMAMMAAPAPPAPPPPPPPPEDLGDVKLYRVPERVTVAPRAQKQVALLARAAVPFERRYRLGVYPGQVLAPTPARIELVMRNRSDAGLGLPLPSGSTALYARRGGQRLLLGTGRIGDSAEGQTVRVGAGRSAQVLVGQAQAGTGRWLVTASNATAAAVALDVPVGGAGAKIRAEDAALEAVDGVATWRVRVPANGRATMAYRVE